MSTAAEHETGLVALIAPAKRDRMAIFLGNPKRRRKFVDDLWHFRDWDPEAVVRLAASVQTSEAVLAELTRRGAASDVYVVSATSKLDARSMALQDAIESIVGSSSGTVVSCVAGRLAYFEGEEPGDRCILARP